MNYDGLVFDKSSGVATLRLNNPEKLNALTFQTYADLAKVMADLAHDDEVKVVLLTGTGKGFCSGGNVDEIIGPLLEMKNDELYKFTRLTCDVVSNMRQLKKPIIAAATASPPALARSSCSPLICASFPTRRASRFSLLKSVCQARTWARSICCRGSSAWVKQWS